MRRDHLLRYMPNRAAPAGAAPKTVPLSQAVRMPGLRRRGTTVSLVLDDGPLALPSIVPPFAVCVPTLYRYDGLRAFIASVEAGTLKPALYYVIDNGGSLTTDGLPQNVKIVRPGQNLGVSGSWNLALDMCNAGALLTVIGSDDIIVMPETLAVLVASALACADPIVLARATLGSAQSHYPFPATYHLFCQPDSTLRYDTGFYPAYYEDVDMGRRITLRGRSFRGSAATIGHPTGTVGNTLAPVETVAPEIRRMLDEPTFRDAKERCAARYVRKWGGQPGLERFDREWNAQQIETELAWWMDLLIQHRVRRLVSIGLFTGGVERAVADRYAQAQMPLDIVGVDPVVRPELRETQAELRSMGINMTLLPSLSELNGDFDAAFIDGDHSYDGVRYDWQMLRGRVRHIIGFHDIVDSERHRAEGCFVSRLWAELRASDIRTDERIDDGTWAGIGVVMMNP